MGRAYIENASKHRRSDQAMVGVQPTWEVDAGESDREPIPSRDSLLLHGSS